MTGRATESTSRLAAMTIDVEDWYQVENLRRVVPRHTWQSQQLRVDRAMDRMLELMAEWNVKATCFILGDVAERAPGLVGRIAAAGHEIASHGHRHELVSELEPAEFRADVAESKQLLEDMTGQRVRGYRAPSFSLTEWAFPILRDVGFEYDSSLFPTTIAHDRYGKLAWLNARQGPIVRHAGLTEVSLSCLSVGAHALPWAGGGYFRLLPYRVFKLGVERILSSGKPYIFYIHPWELDVTQPRVGGLRRAERIRHYLNLEKTESRWISLLRDFRWMTIGELLLHHDGMRDGAGQIASDRDRAVDGVGQVAEDHALAIDDRVVV